MTIGLVTAQAKADEAKGRKKRERERAGLPPEGSETAAHAAAEGGQDGMHEDGDGDCGPAMAGKAAFGGIGIHEGPGMPLQPGELDPAGLNRPYLSAGHGAPSPQYQRPTIPHVDFSRARGQMVRLNPHAPASPAAPGGAQ